MIYKKKHLLIFLACLALVVSALSCTQGQRGGVTILPSAPRPPAWMELQMPKAPRVGEEVELTCTMYSGFWDLPGEASIEFEIADREHSYRGMLKVPPEGILVSGDLSWKGILEAGAETRFSCVIKFPYEGEWEVLGHFNIDDDWVNPHDWASPGKPQNSIKLHVGKDSGTFGWPRDYRPMMAERIPDEEHPLTVKLHISKAPRLGEPAELTCSMNSIRDVAEAKGEIEFYRMEGTNQVNVRVEDILVEGDLIWEGSLNKDAPIQFSAAIKFPEEGDWWIKAFGSSPEDIGGCGHSLFLNVGKEKGRFGWVEPHEKPHQGPEPPPCEYEPFRVELHLEKTPRLNEPVKLTCTLISPSENITARAQVKFSRPAEAGVSVPLQELLVEGDLSWEGSVKEGIPVQFSAIIKFPLEGDWRISLSVEGRCGRRTYSRSDRISLHVTED